EMAFEIRAPHRVWRLVRTESLSVWATAADPTPLSHHPSFLQDVADRAGNRQVEVGAAAAHDDEQLSWSPPRVLPPRRDELGDDLLGHCVRMRQRSARTIDELLYTAALVPLDPLVAGLTADPESLA